MSMLSEQVNKLRMLADKLRNVHARQGDDYVESCETLYWSMCAMLDDADTILSLQDRLQSDITNIDTAHDPKSGGYVVSFDAKEVPEIRELLEADGGQD